MVDSIRSVARAGLQCPKKQCLITSAGTTGVQSFIFRTHLLFNTVNTLMCDHCPTPCCKDRKLRKPRCQEVAVMGSGLIQGISICIAQCFRFCTGFMPRVIPQVRRSPRGHQRTRDWLSRLYKSDMIRIYQDISG